MIRTFFRIAAFSLLCAEAFPAPTANGFPYNDEELNYSINWPSGLSLGEGHLRAKRSGGTWDFELELDASLPGFRVKDIYQSQSSAEFCSISFERTSSHGARKTGEKTTIDRSRSAAIRVTQGKGGKSEIPVADCVKDALTYLFFMRKELGQGRVPTPQAVLFGSLRQIQLEYAGAPTIQVNEQPVQADKMICTMKGPSSDLRFEMYFARDVARTPVKFRVPLSMGTFDMELVR